VAELRSQLSAANTGASILLKPLQFRVSFLHLSKFSFVEFHFRLYSSNHVSEVSFSTRWCEFGVCEGAVVGLCP